MNNQQFYLSPTKGHDCIKLPKKDSKYLLIDNYLSEFYTDEDKEKVLSNLGILLRLEALKNLIDQKVIEFGGVAWDLVPTEGNTDHVLSSDTLYNLLSRYYTQEEIDTKIEQLFSIFVRDFKVTTDDSLSDTSENPVQNKVIKQALDELLNRINNIPEIGPSTNIEVDSELSETSRNPLQNKVIKLLLDNKVDLSQLENYVTSEQLLNQLSNQSNTINAEKERAQNSESQLNSKINNNKTLIDDIQDQINHQIKHVFITQSAYDALETYERDTLYLIIEQNGSKLGEDTFPLTLG